MCEKLLQEFAKAVLAYQKKLNSVTSVPKLDVEMEKKRKIIVRSFSLARNLYQGGCGSDPTKESSELEAGAEFLEVYTYI